MRSERPSPTLLGVMETRQSNLVRAAEQALEDEKAAWWNTTTFHGDGEAASPLRSHVAWVDDAVRPAGSDGSLFTKNRCTGPSTTS